MSDSNRPFGQVCQHGSLKRKCTICDQDAEITELKAQLAAKDREIEIYKRGAKQSGELFCWCVTNLKSFPPIDGEWLDEIKRRLLASESHAALAASEPTKE
jgi:hypothetical protein